jgi:hypothetical protein
MAQANQTPEKANAALPHQGDHDRVAMLSLKVDGTADQHNPEFIGDKEFALQATRRQFAEQAVSAVDVAERGASTGSADVAEDPAVKALKEKHDSAAESAEKAAEKAVESLSKD